MKFRTLNLPHPGVPWIALVDLTVMVLCLLGTSLFFWQQDLSALQRLPANVLARPASSSARSLLLELYYVAPESGSTVAPADAAAGQEVLPYVRLASLEVPLAEVGATLNEQAIALAPPGSRRARRTLDDVTVTIRAAPDVAAGHMQELVRLCQVAGFTRFALARSDSGAAPAPKPVDHIKPNDLDTNLNQAPSNPSTTE